MQGAQRPGVLGGAGRAVHPRPRPRRLCDGRLDGHAGRLLHAERECEPIGLVHGLAFSATLSELDLGGSQLALSLLGFNVGIEIMQLAIVAVVLPPLLLLARTRAYPFLRIIAAVIAGIAAIGWLLTRLGSSNAIADAADQVGGASPYLIAALWGAAMFTVVSRRAGLVRDDTHREQLLFRGRHVGRSEGSLKEASMSERLRT